MVDAAPGIVPAYLPCRYWPHGSTSVTGYRQWVHARVRALHSSSTVLLLWVWRGRYAEVRWGPG
eukprot:2218606-Amphidinium_carterae.1